MNGAAAVLPSVPFQVLRGVTRSPVPFPEALPSVPSIVTIVQAGDRTEQRRDRRHQSQFELMGGPPPRPRHGSTPADRVSSACREYARDRATSHSRIEIL